MANNETTISIRVFSDLLTCKEISNVMKLEPTQSYERGEPVSKNSKLRREESLWVYSPELDGDLEEKIQFLADTLSKIKSINTVNESSSVEFFCSVVSENGQAHSFLSKAIMRQLSKLDVDLSIEYYLA